MPAPRNPADLGADLERPLGRAWLAWLLSLYRAIPESLIRQAIRTGKAVVITASETWVAHAAAVAERVTPIERELLRRGFVSGFREVPGTNLLPRAASLAEQLAGPRTLARVQSIDDASRKTIQALINSASRSYRASPSLATLRELAADIKPLIGLTPKQAAQLRRQWRNLRAAGLPTEAIRSTIASRADKMRGFRAKGIADRGVVESISAARHQAWIEARDAGEISASAMKQWRDQGDDRVRASHRAQTRMGPIPLDELYPIQGVMHPPSPDPGCRCWDTLVDLERPSAAPAAARPAGTTSTAEQRAARAEELRRRRAEFEPRRAELERAALARQASGAPSRSTSALSPAERARRAQERTLLQLERDQAKTQGAWVSGSRNKTSVHFQEAIRRELGLDVKTWNPKHWPIDDALVDRYRPAVRQMYERTQAELQRLGIREVTLYRGVKTTAVPLRGVAESWTSERSIADWFSGKGPLGESGIRGAGKVLEIRIDVRRILTWHQGPGWKDGRYGQQFEWILLGGKI